MKITLKKLGTFKDDIVLKANQLVVFTGDDNKATSYISDVYSLNIATLHCYIFEETKKLDTQDKIVLNIQTIKKDAIENLKSIYKKTIDDIEWDFEDIKDNIIVSVKDNTLMIDDKCYHFDDRSMIFSDVMSYILGCSYDSYDFNSTTIDDIIGDVYSFDGYDACTIDVKNLLKNEIFNMSGYNQRTQFPESFLSPMMQYKMGTFLSGIVNDGVMLSLVTHSDYILSTINKYIRLYKIKEKNSKDYDNILSKHKSLKHYIINPICVSSYYINDNTIKTHDTSDGIKFDLTGDVVKEMMAIDSDINDVLF